MGLPMEMMNPILVDDGVAGEGMEANTLFMEPMGAEFRSAAFSSACRASLGASRRSARAASAAVFASSSGCGTPQSSAKLKDRAAASDPTHHERTPMGNADILSIQLYTLRSLGELDRVLDTVKQAGYRHVETVGSQLDDAENVRTKLDVRGLKVSSSHVSLAALRERPDVVVRACRTLWASTSSLCLPCRRNSGRATRRSGARWGASSARSPSACATRGSSSAITTTTGNSHR